MIKVYKPGERDERNGKVSVSYLKAIAMQFVCDTQSVTNRYVNIVVENE